MAAAEELLSRLSAGGSSLSQPKKPLPKLPPKLKHGRARSFGGDVALDGSGSSIIGAPDTDAYRNKILAELLNTERSYIISLEQFLNVIKLLRSAPTDAITPKQVLRLASNTEMLLNFHRSGLLPQLENLIGRKEADDVNVGSVIISFMPFLKATYAQFVNNYSFAISTLKELAATPKFLQWTAANWKPEGPGSTFDTYVDLRLITPVQRIPRYELLLKDLLRHTPTCHKEHTTLSEAYDKVKAVAEFVNEKKAEAERMQQLLTFESLLREDQHRQSIVLATPGRFLVNETKVSVHRSSDKSSHSISGTALTSTLTLGGTIGPNTQPREGKIILFNDSVLIARKKSAASERLSFAALLYIKPLVAQDLGGLDFSLQAEKDALRSSIVKEGKTFKFSALTEASKAALLSGLTDAKTLLATKEAAAKTQGRPKIHVSIALGDMPAIQDVIRNDSNSVHAVDRKGQTPLHIAVKKHDQELAKFLLLQGANTKAMSHDGLTPVDLATKLGDEAMLSILQPKLRTGKQDNEGFIHGVAGVGTAVGSVVGKGLFMPLRMFKKEESVASSLGNNLKRDSSSEVAPFSPGAPGSCSEEHSPEKLALEDSAGSGKTKEKEGSRKSLISFPSAIPLIGRSDKENKAEKEKEKQEKKDEKEKDKQAAQTITVSAPIVSAGAPLVLSNSGGPPASPKVLSPRVETSEERARSITTRISDIELHMAALAHEKSALEQELLRLQRTTPAGPSQQS